MYLCSNCKAIMFKAVMTHAYADIERKITMKDGLLSFKEKPIYFEAGNSYFECITCGSPVVTLHISFELLIYKRTEDEDQFCTDVRDFAQRVYDMSKELGFVFLDHLSLEDNLLLTKILEDN